MAVSEWQIKMMKLAVATAVLQTKPPDCATEDYVTCLATSWMNRNQRDAKYIRWLELERMQLLQKTALLTVKDTEEDTSNTAKDARNAAILSPIGPGDFNLTQATANFLKSTIQFLRLSARTTPNFAEILAATTEDIVRNTREMMTEPALFAGSFSGLLETCCAGLREVVLGEPSVTDLVQLGELLVNFVCTLKSNASCAEGATCATGSVISVVNKNKPAEDPSDSARTTFSTSTKTKEVDAIRISLSSRTEKQVLSSCLAELARNTQLTQPLQRLLIEKIEEICEALCGSVICRKPHLVDSLYYLIEGLYRSGPVLGDNMPHVNKCIELSIVKFPLAARLLIICSKREKV